MSSFTREQVLAMPASGELDRLIGQWLESVGWHKPFICPRCGGDWFDAWAQDGTVKCKSETENSSCAWKGTWDKVPYPAFSQDIRYTWAAVNWLLQDGWEVSLEGNRDSDNDEIWWVSVWCPYGPCEKHDNPCDDRGHGVPQIDAPTAPLAICRAALLCMPDRQVDGGTRADNMKCESTGPPHIGGA